MLMQTSAYSESSFFPMDLLKVFSFVFFHYSIHNSLNIRCIDLYYVLPSISKLDVFINQCFDVT